MVAQFSLQRPGREKFSTGVSSMQDKLLEYTVQDCMSAMQIHLLRLSA